MIRGNKGPIIGVLAMAMVAIAAPGFAGLNVNSGEYRENAGTTSVSGDVNVASGATLVNAGSINVGGAWTVDAAGIFADSGTVTFNGSAAQTVTSGGVDASHDFNNLAVANTSAEYVSFADAFTTVNFTCNTANDALKFLAGATYIVSGTLTLNGQATGTEIKLHSSASPTRFTISPTGGNQQVRYVDVKDSNASTNSIVALNSVNSGNNDDAEAPPHWVFGMPTITYPVSGKTVGRKPTIIGTAGPHNTVSVYALVSGVSTKVAEVTADANGSYRVKQNDFTADLDLNANSLTPQVSGTSGTAVIITVADSPTTDHVPVITSPADNSRARGAKPTITGKGLAGQTVTLYANDALGNLLLANVASSTVDASGNFTIASADYTTSLPKGAIYLNVVVDDVNSLITTIIATDPFGVVFDSDNNTAVGSAVVTIYDSAGAILAPGIAGAGGCKIDASDTNPQTVGADGAYSYLCDTASGYTIKITADGYHYPSTKTTFPAGRVIVTGSKNESFDVGTAIIEMDHPMDPQPTLLKISKEANKKEVVVGDIVTYTMTIQNISGTAVSGIYIEDRIPAGFKYIEEKAILDGVRISDPSGNRPISFNIGEIAAGVTKTLKYQLVVGSGVTFGNYENTAHARYVTGLTISNVTTATVKVTPDPLFDMGTIIGKVFMDWNKNGIQDSPDGGMIEQGIADARVAMEDGAVVTTDPDGKFHIPMIIPGEHIFRIDERSLPAGMYLTTRNEEIINITNGLMRKVNFGVAYLEEEKAKEALGRPESYITITQDADRPKPRLNAALFGDTLIVTNARLKDPAEFRVFTNYSLFIRRWKLEIFDKDVRKLVDEIEGDGGGLFKAIYWDGLDSRGRVIRPDRAYTYKLTVYGDGGRSDITKEREFKAELQEEPDGSVFSEKESQKEKTRQEEKTKWAAAENRANNLEKQNIILDGGMVKVYSPKAAISGLKIRKADKVIEDIPIIAEKAAAKDLLDKFSEGADARSPATDIILPRGKWTVDAAGAAKEVNVGDDYMFMVGMADVIAGQTDAKGNIEPVRDARFKDGLWADGKLAYYLKGKIKGKYLVTSSLDTERRQKELFKIVDPNKYYPVYGDAGKIDYDGQDTQGKFYALVEWDRSSVKWGNYETGLSGTELSNYERTLYGGKIHYESLSASQYGDPTTKVVLFNATAKQMASHNEFTGTGGSLYYLKHKYIIEGSDKIEIQVRDKINGLVLTSMKQKRGSDYQINYDEGRVIFWKPISYISESTPVISTQVSDGNKVYVVADYEYETKDKYDEAARGGRVSQQIGDMLRVGGTYVKEEKNKKNFELKGADAALTLGKNTRITGEYAQTISGQMNNYISTNGGIDFTTIPMEDFKNGKAISVRAETKLLDRASVGAYYQRVEKGFSTAETIANQGTEKKGVRANIRLLPDMEANLWHDIQTLMDDGNPQTQTQVGARETQTSTAQIIYHLERADFTSEYRRQRVKRKISGTEAETNDDVDIVAARLEWRPTNKLTASIKQEVDLNKDNNNKTTLGGSFRPTERLTLTAAQSVGTEGASTKVGADFNVNKNISLNAERVFDAKGPSTSVGAAAKVNEKMDVSGAVKQEGQKKIAGLAGEVKLNDKEGVYGSLNQELQPGQAEKNSVVLGKKRKFDKGVEVKSERSFIRSDREASEGATYTVTKDSGGKKISGSLTKQSSTSGSGVSDSNILGLSGGIGDKFAVTGNFEKGEVNNLDSTQTRRYAASLAASYLEKDKFKASAKLEGRLDKAREDTAQTVVYLALEGRVTDDLSLFNKTNISHTRNLTANTTQGRYKEILTGFAYRPLYFDKWNFIGKYIFLEDDTGGVQQEDYKDIEKIRAQVYGLEGIYDLNSSGQIILKAAFKQNEEMVSGFGDYTKTQTWLGILRYNHKFLMDYELGLEYRMLRQVQAKDYKQGVLLELDRYFGKWMKGGVGYNFTRFSDDLAHENYSTYGWFVRATSSLGEVASEMIRTQEEKVKALKIDGERRFSEIMRLPKDAARVQEVVFYREQAKHWMAIGEYQEAYNCLRKGIRSSEDARLDLFMVETQRLMDANREKMAAAAELNDRIEGIEKGRLAQALLIRNKEERNYQLLKLFYETGKIYFMAGQYRKAVNEWELGLEVIREFGPYDNME